MALIMSINVVTVPSIADIMVPESVNRVYTDRAMGYRTRHLDA